MRVTKHPAERFIDWFPANTKLYIRGELGKSWEARQKLYAELFDNLVPFFDNLTSSTSGEPNAE